MADVVIQAQSTLFNRQGETTQKKGYFAYPAGFFDRVMGNYIESTLANGMTSTEQLALFSLLVQNPYIIPGGQTLFNVQQDCEHPDQFRGAVNLQALYELDPFDTTYETETTALYTRSYSVARAAAQSGPTNVRGGTARQGFELAELDTQQSINRFREVWQNQMAVASLVIQAAQVANAAEAERRNASLRAQQQQAATEQGRVMQVLSAAEQLVRDRESHIRSLAAGAEFLAVPGMITHEELQGEGFQGGATTSFGMSYWR